MCSARKTRSGNATVHEWPPAARGVAERSLRDWGRLLTPDFATWPADEPGCARQGRALCDGLHAFGCVLPANADARERRAAAGLWRQLKYEYGPLVLGLVRGQLSADDVDELAGAELAFVRAVARGDTVRASRWVRQLLDPCHARFAARAR